MDKLSDYLPASNEISRVPSRQDSVAVESEVESELAEDAPEEDEDDDEEEEEEDDQAYDEGEMDDFGSKKLRAGSKPKTPGELRKIEESKARRAKLNVKKAKKKQIDSLVRSSSYFFCSLSLLC